MRSKKRTIGIMIVVIVVLLGFAGSLLVYRNKLSSEKTKNNSNNNTAQSLPSAPSGKSIENFYDKPITDEKIALDSIEVNRDKLGYADKNFTFIYDEKSGSKTAYHFDLYYKDIPVYEKGVGVFTHYSDNSAKVLMSNVSDAEKIIKVNTTPKITQDEALNVAKETLGENFSEYNIGANFEKVKVKPKLIIYKYNDEYKLAYYIQSGFYMCVINAESGDIITAHSTLVSKSAEYEGQRKGDTQQIFYDDVTNSDDGELKDNALYCMEKNIYILDDLEKGKLDFKKLLTLNDIESGKNKSAVDAMANTYKAIKYFEKIDIDISFLAIYVQVNDTDELKNKFPNKTLARAGISQNDEKTKTYAYLNFGTKDMSGRQYSAYLDVVAHEYTHCVTNLKAFGSEGYKKDSIYFERNALMEAYSDIFGELIEQKCTGDTDWKVVDSSLIEPTFGSEYKYKYSKKRKTKDDEGTDENDYGYAHDNSTIISHTAYLMSKSNDSKKYDAEFLLDYNQLAQLWYGSLEYLKKTEFKDFADCRYAIEQSAMDLIEKGVLIDGNLKIIEQAFNEVEVSSNPARRGAMDSAEIKEKHTLVVPIEDETQSTEPVEITEIPTEPTTQTSAIDLIDKTLPEIISLMNGEYQIIKTENYGYIYIQNQSVLSGMEFYIQVSGDDIISANNGEEIHNDTLKAKLESGELTLDGIQVNKSGKVSETIQADMDYKSCNKVLGDFNCIGGTGGYLGGDVSSVSYNYNYNNAKVLLNFEIPEEIYKDLSLGKISSVSAEKMKSYNPNLRNVVIKKNDKIETVDILSLGNGCSGCIDNNGNLYMWGSNLFGRLGNGTTNDSSIPIKIMDNVKSVVLGSSHNAAITEDGSLYMWGGNWCYQLGNGTNEDSFTPIKIMDNVKTVTLGSSHNAVITEDGSLYMWGYNDKGQVGNGTTAISPEPAESPVKIMGNAKAVSLGSEHSGAITEDGSLYM